MASTEVAVTGSASHRFERQRPILRLACTGFVGIALAWGCGSSSDGGTEGSDAAAGSGASAAGGGAGEGSGAEPGSGAAAGTGATGTGGNGNGGTGVGGVGASGSGGTGVGGTGVGGTGVGGTGGLGTGVSDASVPTCDPSTGECRPGLCAEAGDACATGTDCCTFRCEGNVCQAEQCIGDGDACTGDTECCGGSCTSGTCAPLNAVCETAGNECAQSSECCSKYCKDGFCNVAPSWCTQTGDVCSYAEDCCSGSCVFAAGRTSGTCGLPPSGAGCTGKAIEGSVCAGFNDCATCCSKLCAPSAATGVFVCQPTSGCRTEGGLCRVNSDCCGVTGTGLPGDGNGVCEVEPGNAVGFCKTISCIPQGQVCHYDGAGYVCDSGTSDPNSCCGATGTSGRCIDTGGTLKCNGFEDCPAGSQANDSCSLCMLDQLGIPRCNGLDACREAGETCSNSADCCNQLPCIPDDQGVLRCLPTGQCVTDAGSCTVDADCCVSLTCTKPPGSISGSCEPINVPPDPPTGDASTPGDAATPPDDASTPPDPNCAAYGQDCTLSRDCCNYDPSIPEFGCNDGICKFQPG